MNVNGFNPSSLLGQIAGGAAAGGAGGVTAAATDGANSFGSLVKNAVDSLEGSQASADQEIAKAVTGESTDLHKTIIELQSADLKFQLGLQVRNKLINAYEEIMRMQV